MPEQPTTQTALTPWDIVQLARHPQRPRTLDYIRGLCEDFVELRGDRRFGDDRALLGGVARFQGRTVVVLGHQKGSTTKENIVHNFGSPRPEGYRKALRLMQHAEQFGLPVLAFIDTPGADPSMASEERGIGEAIAENLITMARLRVPVIATVIGEGGSGGALAIGVADRLLMLQYAIYSVASPEASAAILWRDASKAPDAARAMRITAADLQELGIVDEIVPEPEGGAHLDTLATIEGVRAALTRHLEAILALPTEELLARRYAKYRSIGGVQRLQQQVIDAGH
ncbi:acetyl-CoA carboxylase carboxyltransferase subunit alpha [Kallotenue papyrolyticum]|uniref:acetyl-CoA carboxylase carboxyltransferase subunit alpha n=1 Tax=Kallotenue papyrolyticum TaxID=1325125 RepID=UPI0004785A81|nr:acetyl-CoA carboxylase carboxyltransferase subunit alpha [Kallotenue papyrolyticum]